MEKNKITKVKLSTVAILVLLIGICIIVSVVIINNNTKLSKSTNRNIEAINETTQNQDEKKSQKVESVEERIPEEKEIIALIKERNSSLSGYNTVKFGVCGYDQSSIDKEIKNSVICSIDMKASENLMGKYLDENGKSEDIPWFQDEKKEQPTKVKDISDKYVLSEAYIGGDWNISVCVNLFSDIEAKNAGLSQKEMNEMNFIEAKRLSYKKKKEKNEEILYEIIDVSNDTLLVRQTDLKNRNKVTIEVYKDMGNGCHIKLHNNNMYSISLGGYTKYKDCSKEELLLLGKKLSGSISIIRTQKVELSEKWQRLLSK